MDNLYLTSEQATVRHADVFQEKLRVLDAAAVGVILCRTREPQRAIDAIKTYSFSKDRAFANWNIIRGWETYDPADPAKDPTADNDASPVSALNAIGGLGQGQTPKPNGFYTMMYPHFFMADNQGVRVPIIAAIKEYASLFSESKRRLVLICPEGTTLPSELNEDIVTLDFDVPSYAELAASLDFLIDNTFASKKPNIVGDARSRIVAAGMGMNQQEFETAVSRAIVTHRAQLPNVDVDDIVDEVMKVKTEVVNRSEVLEVMPAGNMSDVGGLDNLKTWIGKRRGCFTDEAKAFGIEAPKGAGLFGPPGTRFGGQPAGSKVLMSDGNWRQVEDVRIGDKVLSPLEDGSVQPVAIGKLVELYEQTLFRLTTSGRSGAKTFLCSDGSELSIVSMERPRRSDGTRTRHTERREISVAAFLDRGKLWRGKAKAYTAPAYDLPEKELPVHPHTLGVILGDGGLTELSASHHFDMDLGYFTGSSATITSPHELLEVLFRRHGWNYPTKLVDRDTSVISILEGPVKEGLRQLGLMRVNSSQKFVPDAYMNSSLAQRLELLAGLIDTDGDHENFYTTSPMLAEAFHKLVYSIGGAAHIRPKVTKYKGRKVDSLAVSYSTAEHVIPTVLDYKRRGERDMSWKNPRNTSFKIEPAGRGTVFGFVLEGEAHRYVTDDYLVTSSIRGL